MSETGRTPFEPTSLDRDDARAAVALGAAALALYAFTACRTIEVGDSSELATAAALFGVPHPPGYPLFTMVTGALGHALPVARDYAANLVAALYAAAAVAALFLLARRIGGSRAGSVLAAASLAFGVTFWQQGGAIEVYGFDLGLALVAMHASLGAARSARSAFVASLLFGLWLAHRPLNLVYAPCVVGLAWLSGGVVRERAGAIALGLVASAAPLAFLPLRSRMHPLLNLGDPETAARFFDVVLGAPYVRHWTEGTPELALGRLVRHVFALPGELGVALVLGPMGLRAALAESASRSVARCFAWLVAANIVVCAAYDVADIAVFFLPSTMALALFAARGADVAGARLRARGIAARGAALALATAVALLAVANFGAADLRAHAVARFNAEDTLESAPRDGLLLARGDTTVHALWYLQAVEGTRPDVIVLSEGHLAPWYFDELRRRYPAEPWPVCDAHGDADLLACARSAVDALGARRPVAASWSVHTQAYVAPNAHGASRGEIPHGLVVDLLPKGTGVDFGAEAKPALGFFEHAMSRVLPLPGRFDDDSATLYFQYALALAESAEAFARVGDGGTAARLSRWVIDLHPDEVHERVRDAMRTIGRDVPPVSLEARARDLLR